jgi:lysophospholipase L1-like esterase
LKISLLPVILLFATALFLSSALLATPVDVSKYPQPIRVACIGDSITQGAFIADPSKFYPSQLQAMLGPQWVVKNFGLSGRTLLRKGDNPYWIESAYQQALAFLPDVVVIMLGTNDTKSRNWVHSDEFIADYKDLIASFKNLPSHPRIYICHPPPVFGAGAYDITEANIQKEIPMIDKIAREENVHVIDMHKPLESKPQLLPDTVHPNAEGAGVMAATVFQALTGKTPSPNS